MERRIYIGPYLKCWPVSANVPDDGALCELLGVNDSPGFDVFGINKRVDWIDRELFYCRAMRNTGVVDIKSITIEMALFETKMAHEIREIRGEYERVEVAWGIVEGLH